MIAYIKGTVQQQNEQGLVLDNNGIGYIIGMSASTLSRLPQKGEEAQVYTYMQVKEDDISLYGFVNQEELSLFRMLISISGIGPKVGMAVLGIMSPEQIMMAIADGDAVAFSRVPGVGKKTAQRITLELQDKINSLMGAGRSSDSGLPSSFPSGGMSALASSEKQDSVEALVSLGYGRSESLKAVLAVATEDMSVDQILRLALNKLK